MAQVKLDSAEIKTFLKHIIDTNRILQKDGKKTVAVSITGESGLGKTTLALDLATEYKFNCVKLNLSQIEELGDLVGMVVRQFQMCKEGEISEKKPIVVEPIFEYIDVEKILPNGQKVKIKQKVEKTPETKYLTDDCLWVDENAVEQYSKKGYGFTGKKRMSYCPPEWIADKTDGGLLILDDFNRSDPRYMQATMELIDRGEYISWKLPPDWHIILTSNPENGKYLVNTTDSAQKSRYISIEMAWSAERWAEWAEKEGIDQRAINFVLLNPEIVTPECNPRSLVTFFNAISSFGSFEKHLPMIQMLGEGSVGPYVATLFTTFINNKLDELVTPKEIFTGSDEKVVGDKLKASIREKDGNYRADIASVLLTRLINYALLYAEVNPIEPKHINRLIYLINEPEIFTDDLKYHLVKKIINGNKTKFQKLLINPEVQNYITK